MSQARVMVFSGLGVLMALRQRQEDSLITGLLFFSSMGSVHKRFFIWIMAGGKVKLTHLLTSQSLIQDVIKAAARNEEQGIPSESKKNRQGRESFEKPPS